MMAELDPITVAVVFAKATKVPATFVSVQDTKVIITHDVPVARGASEAMAGLTALALAAEGPFTVKVAGPVITRRPWVHRS